MDSFVKYPILQQLPSQLLKGGDRKAIHAFLKQKSRTFKRLKVVTIIASIIYLVLLFIFEAVHTKVLSLAKFDNIFNLIPLILFPVLAIIFHKLQKKCDASKNEMDAVMEEINLNPALKI